ncbi:MAG: hypothetical protein COB04_16125 [Gammaproteobacteria bacterium]|nr:MAG: hypothetical protein COB04_16125 [Gammaproteobacteria bacterium]
MTSRLTERTIHKDTGSLSRMTVYSLKDGTRRPVNLELVSRMVLKLFNALGDITIDSDVLAGYLSWNSKGEIIFKLGMESSLVLGETYKSSITAYDSQHPDGQIICSPCSAELLEFYVCQYA